MSGEAGKGDGRRPGKGFDKGFDLIDWPSRRKLTPEEKERKLVEEFDARVKDSEEPKP